MIWSGFKMEAMGRVPNTCILFFGQRRLTEIVANKPIKIFSEAYFVGFSVIFSNISISKYFAAVGNI